MQCVATANGGNEGHADGKFQIFNTLTARTRNAHFFSIATLVVVAAHEFRSFDRVPKPIVDRDTALFLI